MNRADHRGGKDVSREKQLRILLVEDSEDDAQLLVHEIRQAGYTPVPRRVETAAALREALADEPWDLILSDYLIPSFGALEALQVHRESGLDLPFIIVSGHIAEDQLVAAMKAGAHDYLLKGNLSRLVPAIERELREAAERRRRRRLESAITHGKQEWEAAFDAVSDLILLTDVQGRIIRCNRKVVEYFRTTYPEVVGRPILDLFCGDQAHDGCVFTQVDRLHPGTREEIRFPRLEGWFNVTGYPMHLAERNQDGTVYIIEDVTRRKEMEAEKELIDRELLTMYAIAFRLNSTRSPKRIMTDLLFQLHNMLQIDFSSLHLLDKGGLKLKASLGLSRDTEAALRHLPEYPPWVRGVLAGKPFRSRRVPRRLPPALVAAARALEVRAWCAVPLKIGSDVVGVLMVAHRADRDFTEREVFLLSSIANQLAVLIENHTLYDKMKEKNVELQRSKEALRENLHQVKRANIELERLNSAKNTFIGMASHELKTPITSILGGVQFLYQYSGLELTPEQRDIFASVYEGVGQLKGLVDDLLSISRLETSGLVLQQKPLQLVPLSREVLETFTLPLSRRQIRVTIDGEETPVPADESMARLVVRNLLENAIKFTPDGGAIIVSGRSVAKSEVLAWKPLIQPFHATFGKVMEKVTTFFRLDVRDTGIGIPPEERVRIFEKFYGVGDITYHSSGKTEYLSKGSGLGLAIVKAVMEAHGGLVWVTEGDDGQGSVFSLLFPME